MKGVLGYQICVDVILLGATIEAGQTQQNSLQTSTAVEFSIFRNRARSFHVCLLLHRPMNLSEVFCNKQSFATVIHPTLNIEHQESKKLVNTHKSHKDTSRWHT